MQLEDFEELGVVLPIREKKERTELQKINDAKTSQRMKEWHQKRRQEKAKKKEIREEVLAEEKDDDKIIVKFYDLEEVPNEPEIIKTYEDKTIIQYPRYNSSIIS